MIIRVQHDLESSFVRDVYCIETNTGPKIVFNLKGTEYAYPVKHRNALLKFINNAKERGSLGKEYDSFMSYNPFPGEKLL